MSSPARDGETPEYLHDGSDYRVLLDVVEQFLAHARDDELNTELDASVRSALSDAERRLAERVREIANRYCRQVLPARDGETLSDEWLPESAISSARYAREKLTPFEITLILDSHETLRSAVAALRAELAELHRAIDTDGSLAELPPSEQREAFLTIAQDGANALAMSGVLSAENEQLRARLADSELWDVRRVLAEITMQKSAAVLEHNWEKAPDIRDVEFRLERIVAALAASGKDASR